MSQSHVNEFHTVPTTADGDVLQMTRQDTHIYGCTFDMTACPTSVQDEVISCVRGASGTIRNSLIIGGIKAILVGNGDHPIQDTQTNTWTIENCAIFGAGRRCPEVKDGATVYMRNCWIHDWGHTFNVRAFGAWANRGGRIVAEHCLFTQSGGRLSLGVWNTVKDIANHVGNAVNVGGVSALFKQSSWRQGICRGLTAETESGGFVMASHCFANKPWIRIENHENPLTRAQALDVADGLELHLPQFERFIGLAPRELLESIC